MKVCSTCPSPSKCKAAGKCMKSSKYGGAAPRKKKAAAKPKAYGGAMMAKKPAAKPKMGYGGMAKKKK